MQAIERATARHFRRCPCFQTALPVFPNNTAAVCEGLRANIICRRFYIINVLIESEVDFGGREVAPLSRKRVAGEFKRADGNSLER